MVNSRSSKLRESAFVQPTLVGLNLEEVVSVLMKWILLSNVTVIQY